MAGRVPFASWLVTRGDEVLAEHEPERMFSAASMIKTFVLAAALERGGLSDEVPVDERVEGDGVLRLLDLPVRRPMKELLSLMIAISDNTATRAVVRALGGADEVNAWLAGHGFASRIAGGEAPGLPSRPGLGTTSPAEHERVVRRILQQHELGVRMLLEQQDRRALARLLDADARFAHKTGTIDGVRHDGGVLLRHDFGVTPRSASRGDTPSRVWGDTPLFVHAFTDGGPHREWVDHPACVGMGIAMAETVKLLA